MRNSYAAPHAQGKLAKDKIFGAAALAREDLAKYGKDKVINGTQGVLLDEDGTMVCLPTVEKVYRSLPTQELIAYAPIAGLPEYLDKVLEATFGACRPKAYLAAIATAGGTGGIHHAIWNYTEAGDTVLTAEWYWAAYKMLAQDANRKLATYTMLTEQDTFNTPALEKALREVLEKQENALVIINTPAHNPTGYTLTQEEMQDVVNMSGRVAKETGKKIILFIDAAYLDYAGDKNAIRKVFTAFENVPDGVLPIIGYSMSKSFTLYGQRTGAMICVSNDEEAVTEFKNINTYTSRATWSNINRPCMRTLVEIYSHPDLLAQIEKERDYYYKMSKARADVFMKEAKECGLPFIPYKAGFFISIPSKQPDAVCDKLHEDHVFIVPLAAGIRVAVCAIPLKQMPGLATKIYKALRAVEG